MSAGPSVRRVAAAVIVHEGLVLVQTRAEAGPFQGYWEFPGGGVEDGESVEDCARRECEEELGLTVRVLERLHVEDWSYPDVRVCVEFLLCAPASAPEATPREGQELRWATRADLQSLRFLPANVRVLELLAARPSPPRP